MKRKTALLALCLALTLTIPGCHKEWPAEPPDLTGEWTQDSDADYYHIATIDEDSMRIYWYVQEDQSRQPYWIGTFTPPTDGKEPYTWESVNDLELAEHYVRALRDETKTFTYEDGKITYSLMIGRFRTFVSLRRVEDVEAERAATAE